MPVGNGAIKVSIKVLGVESKQPPRQPRKEGKWRAVLSYRHGKDLLMSYDLLHLRRDSWGYIDLLARFCFFIKDSYSISV